MSLAVHQAQRMTFSQDFVQDVAQFPGNNAVLHRGQSERDGPEDLAALLLERPDNRRPDMFLFYWRFRRIDRFVYGDRLQNDCH